jgi:hypothetical protein
MAGRFNAVTNIDRPDLCEQVSADWSAHPAWQADP